jgi:four helix bundle protein
MSVSSFRDLKVWQLGMDIAEKVYRLIAEFPKSETYGLSNQMRRSAVSISSNIAEGQGRDSTKEFLHFLATAFGSICELETQLILSHRLNYLSDSDLQIVLNILTEASKTTRGLQKSLKSKLVSNE